MKKTLTYKDNRGFHFWICQLCPYQLYWYRETGKDSNLRYHAIPTIYCQRIPDQASSEYQHNGGNPIIGLCGEHSKTGRPTADIKIYPSSCQPDPIIPDGDPNSLKLEGVWSEYDTIARQFEHKASHQDREDLRHRIIIRLCDVANKREASGDDYSYLAKLRTASYVTLSYWRDEKRNGRLISLNTPFEDVEGETQELIDTVADDKAWDLDDWLDARLWLMGCPKRLIEIGVKRLKGQDLEPSERVYLHRFRKKHQLKLKLPV